MSTGKLFPPLKASVIFEHSSLHIVNITTTKTLSFSKPNQVFRDPYP